MFAQSVCGASKHSDSEEELQFAPKYKRQQAQSFASGKWLLLSCGAAVCLSLTAHFLHAKVVTSQSRRQEALTRTPLQPPSQRTPLQPLSQKPKKAQAIAAPIVDRSRDIAHGNSPTAREELEVAPPSETKEVSSPQLSPEVETVTAPKVVQNSKLITGEEFHMCNAAVPNLDFSGGRTPDAILQECHEADATQIAATLQSLGYNFETVLPQPYIYPAYLQQVLSMLQGQPLTLALKSLMAHVPRGSLGTLVKFFAWGLPVGVGDLEAALDASTIDSLRTCGMLAKCTKLKDMVTSSIMIFPVPNSTLLVATDWTSRSTSGMHEEVVPIVDPESMALVYNAPNAKGLKTLDYNAGSGLQGLVAASRGASEVTMYYHNPRAIRFMRFSSWMNRLSVKLLGSHDRLTDVYDLMLAQPPFLPVPNAQAAARYTRNGGKDGTKALRDALKVATKVLGSSGVLALYSEFNAEDLINQDSPKNLCHLGLTGFQGSTVIRSQPLQPDAYALAHAGVANVDVQLKNMRGEGITGISNGFVFAKRQEAWQKDECGEFSLQLLEDPIKWPTKTTSKYDRACYLSQETQCPDNLGQ